jgi:hypothetical protein
MNDVSLADGRDISYAASMTEQGSQPSTRVRERWLIIAVLLVLILFRAFVFIAWEESQFDADQAVMGLMAKHISQGRAFPVFFYGSNHILAVEAWLAAPVFLLAGVSVAALKLPLLLVNFAIAILLVRLFERESGLRPTAALVPILFFAVPAPGTAAALVEPSGGNVEPMLYTLLLWMTRDRPAWCGVIFALGFLHREFTLYAMVAMLTIEGFRGRLLSIDGLRRRLPMARSAIEVWLLVQVLRYSSSAAGPGTTLADVPEAHSNITELTNRICMDLQTLPGGFWKLLTVHFPALFGVTRQPMLDFAVDTRHWQGLKYGGFVLAATMLVAGGGIVHRLVTERQWRKEYDFCAYLTLTGVLSALGYVVARCGAVDLMRYELLSIIGGVGLTGWFLATRPARSVRTAWIGLAVACAIIPATANFVLLRDYVTHPSRVGARRLVAKHLEAQGVRYGTSDYWLAYSLTFLTNERIILASDDVDRIATYDRIVGEHKPEAVRISRQRCDGGQMAAGVWICPAQ